jgi:hypothetical protein
MVDAQTAATVRSKIYRLAKNNSTVTQLIPKSESSNTAFHGHLQPFLPKTAHKQTSLAECCGHDGIVRAAIYR